VPLFKPQSEVRPGREVPADVFFFQGGRHSSLRVRQIQSDDTVGSPGRVAQVSVKLVRIRRVSSVLVIAEEYLPHSGAGRGQVGAFQSGFYILLYNGGGQVQPGKQAVPGFFLRELVQSAPESVVA
jgi:hypothetical protein